MPVSAERRNRKGDWRARFVSDVVPVVAGFGYGYGDTAISSQSRCGVVNGVVTFRP